MKISMKTLGVALLLVCQPVTTALAQSADPAIHVQGSGEVSVKPDAFAITFVLEQKGPTVSKLNKQLLADLKSVVTFLREEGVKENRIQSMQVRLNPWYESTPQGREEKGFVLSREVKVTHQGIEDFDKLIDGVLTRGVSRIQQFDFIVTDKEKAYQKALINAVKDAKLRATLLAQEMGVALGQVMSLTESSGGMPMPIMRAKSYSEDASTTLPGQQAISANVSVSFAIQQAAEKAGEKKAGKQD